MRRRALWLGFALVIVAAVVAVAVGGCEAIVGSDLPPFACTGTDPSACPAGEVCVQGACVACQGAQCGEGDAGMDATLSDRFVPPTEGGGDGNPSMDGPALDRGVLDVQTSDGTGVDAPTEAGDGGCRGALGCACSAEAGCESGICGNAEVLGTTLTMAHGASCTTTCCTSANCPFGYVCFGPGNAGGYCVLSTDIGAPAMLGTVAAGATCHANTDCRSGSCVAGRCVDMCCLDADCAAGTSCALDTSGVNGHESFVCQATSGGALHASCSNASQCADNVCEFGTCRGHCCGAVSCSASNFTVCALDTAGSDSVYDCDYPTPPGGAAFGQPCTHATDCSSRECNTTSGTCTDACCRDSDCATYGTYVCRPAVTAPYNLRCTAP